MTLSIKGRQHEIKGRKPRCSRCGYCCTEYGLNITPGDIGRWQEQGRDDILRYLRSISWLGGYANGWFDLKTTAELNHCPFLRKIGDGKYECAIQETKPEICQRFWCKYAWGVGRKGEPFDAEDLMEGAAG